MKFIIGIGNPGKAYEGTRHNAGFQVLERLGRKLDGDSGQKIKWDDDERSNAWIKIYKDVGLARPQTFVNLTGEAVAALADKNSCTPGDLLIVCDDVNLAFGKLRLRASGSAGGHHGLASIIKRLGSDDFPRLRIGVGNEKMPKDLALFVLEEFQSQEKKELKKVLEKAVLVCRAWEEEGFESAQACLSRVQSI
ncbi:MAG: aminoacyl-tRNA hydrolase [Candidatus Omnitrophica bacterium CG07_land_8_20_14_0_80_50_8]|nr:MAG: aminoacyl-tRNA hydrolase [Candidatus Omnitrophica bacterium CG1_02_49_16]PIU40277.1 MAG: aminoacyl-tRNA hydrolase [Candidatus Omnitrophica bacterium CG07_land_8_20_14_0_80_50_8]